MDLGRFHRAIDAINSDAKDLEVVRQLNVLIQDLNNLAGNPGASELSKAFKDHLDEFRNSLTTSYINDCEDATITKVVADLDLQSYVGNGLYERVFSTLQSNQLSPNLAAASLAKTKEDVEAKLSLINRIDDAFGKLDVEYFFLEENEAEMLIDMPIHDNGQTLNDLAKQTKEWHRICESIAETFDPQRSPVTLKTLSTGSWLFYLGGATTFILGVATCLKGINSILTELVKMKAIYGQLVENNAPEEILKKLDDHNSSKVKKNIDAFATKLIKENYKGTDTGRKNELRNALALSLNKLAHKLAEGTKVELQISIPAPPEIAEGQEPTPEQKQQLQKIEELKKIQIEVQASKPTLEFKDHREALQKALPAPTTDESDQVDK